MGRLLLRSIRLGGVLALVLVLAGLGAVALGNAIVMIGAGDRLRGEVAATPEAEVAIILGAGPGSPTLDARLDAGLELWRAGHVHRILITGGTDGTGYGETEYMWRYLRSAGVPEKHIVVDPFGLRTLDSVWRAKRVFGFQHAIVVTQRYHLYRGVFLARRCGIDAEGFVAREVDSPEFRYSVRREWLARPFAVLDLVRGRKPRHGDQPPTLANHPAHES